MGQWSRNLVTGLGVKRNWQRTWRSLTNPDGLSAEWWAVSSVGGRGNGRKDTGDEAWTTLLKCVKRCVFACSWTRSAEENWAKWMESGIQVKKLTQVGGTGRAWWQNGRRQVGIETGRSQRTSKKYHEEDVSKAVS